MRRSISKLLISVITIVVFMGCSTTAFAIDKYDIDLNSTENNGTWKETILDETTYAKCLVEKSGLSKQEAERKAHDTFVELDKMQSAYSSAPPVLTTVTYTYYPPGCQAYGIGVEYGFYAYKASGSPSSYIQAWSPWGLSLGNSSFQYINGGLSAVVNSGRVLFNANGNLEVAVQNSVVTGTTISGGTLVNLGFQSGSSIGTTTYYRKYISVSKTFYPS